MIEVKALVDLIVIMIGISLICSNWEPPIQKSLQALIVLVLGCLLGIIMGKGLAVGLLAGTIAFWRGELISIVKDMKEESIDLISFSGSESDENGKENE